MTRRRLFTLVALSCLLAGMVVWATGRAAPLYFSWVSAVQPGGTRVLGGDRIADIDGLPIEGLRDNVSGLTYSGPTGTLFTVTNRPPQVAELTTDGRLLRIIKLRNALDPEGITHVEGATFILSDEGDQTMHWVTITPQTTELTLGQGQRLTLDIDSRDNMGFEGVSWDAVAQRLYLVQEQLPLRVISIAGLPTTTGGNALALDIQQWGLSWLESLLLLDLSSVSLHETSGTLLLVSHMSAFVAEFTVDGTPVGYLSLRAGQNGLRDTVQQAEGLTVGPDGRVYVVSEPNLFYRFVGGAGPVATSPSP